MIQCWLMPGALLSPPHLLYFNQLTMISPTKWAEHGSTSPNDRGWQCLGIGADRGAAGSQELLEFLSLRFSLLTAAVTWASGQGMLPWLPFVRSCFLYCSFPYLCCGQEKRRGAAHPLNTIIPGIIETIVFSHPFPHNGIAWPQIEKP